MEGEKRFDYWLFRDTCSRFNISFDDTRFLEYKICKIVNHAIFNGPTLFDLTRYIALILIFPSEDSKIRFFTIHDSFAIFSLIYDFPCKNMITKLIILCFIIFGLIEFIGLANQLALILKKILKLHLCQLEQYINLKSKVLNTLKQLKYNPPHFDTVGKNIDDMIEHFFRLSSE